MGLNEKKDFLFLCQFFYPEYNSSATLPFDTAKYLVAQGFSVSALCGYPKEYTVSKDVPLCEIVEGVNIRRLKYSQKNRKSFFGRLINYFSFTFKVWLNRSYLKQYKCVIVYSNPPILPYIPYIAKRKYGTKFVFVAYDVYPEVAYASKNLTPESTISKFMNILNRKIFGSVDHVIALTDEMREFLLNNRAELDCSRISTISNWAHESKRPPTTEDYQHFGYVNGQFIVSYFGNMGVCQDMETLIGAARMLKEDSRVKFLFVGHGSKKNHVISNTSDLPNVQVLDFLTGSEFEQAVAISSVAVVSLERGLVGTCAPSKYYSYLQGGMPVIAVVESNSYLAKETEYERIGYYVEIGDNIGLVNAILKLVNDRSECYNMGLRADLLYKNHYSIDIGLNKYLSVLRRVIG